VSTLRKDISLKWSREPKDGEEKGKCQSRTDSSGRVKGKGPPRRRGSRKKGNEAGKWQGFGDHWKHSASHGGAG
jgi:hypothetical protein